MAIVEINGYTGAKTPDEILGSSNIIFYGDFTSTDNLVMSGSSVSRVNDKMGGTAYGQAQGFFSKLSVGTSGFLGWDPTTASSVNNTYFRMYNLPSTNASNDTVIFIGELVSAGSVIVTQYGATSDNRGFKVTSSNNYQYPSSGTPRYYQTHNQSLAVGQTFATSSWAKTASVNISNAESFIDGVKYPTLITGSGTYNTYRWDAIGNGRNTGNSSSYSPFIHEIIYYNGKITQAQWNDLMTLYVTPKYGV